MRPGHGLSLDGNLELGGRLMSLSLGSRPRESKRSAGRGGILRGAFGGMLYRRTRVGGLFPRSLRGSFCHIPRAPTFARIADEAFRSRDSRRKSNRSPDPPVGPGRGAPATHQVKALKSWHQQSRRGFSSTLRGADRPSRHFAHIRESLRPWREVALIVVSASLLFSSGT